jgi:hypothetical protein
MYFINTNAADHLEDPWNREHTQIEWNGCTDSQYPINLDHVTFNGLIVPACMLYLQLLSVSSVIRRI